MNLQGIRSETLCLTQGARNAPWISIACCQILARCNRPSLRFVLQRRVIDILAHVVLIQSNAAVGCECDVLRVDHIDEQVDIVRVLEIDVPEPAWPLMRQLQRHGVANPLPHADTDPAVLRNTTPACTARGPE